MRLSGLFCIMGIMRVSISEGGWEDLRTVSGKQDAKQMIVTSIYHMLDN